MMAGQLHGLATVYLSRGEVEMDNSAAAHRYKEGRKALGLTAHASPQWVPVGPRLASGRVYSDQLSSRDGHAATVTVSQQEVYSTRAPGWTAFQCYRSDEKTDNQPSSQLLPQFSLDPNEPASPTSCPRSSEWI